MILCDTGVLVCFVDKTQPKYAAYSRLLRSLKLKLPLVTTWACLTEAMYLAGRGSGYLAQKQLGGLLQARILEIYEIQVGDYDRLFGLMEQYRDRPMDFADATLVLTAERMGIKQILTLDSDFLFYRINESESFEMVAVE
ncbi:MAG: type II toxin-antitoxin system VapC family toxin [Leptolyngbya sp. UWPOB_LEPTO1]|uniref:type II toxin-antitoxin system VapC family toxin n=1 Tax=Leptolyngbya sp. UWPOB_LEPTO1 TaxID=2815653 RepID=UPI001ACAEC7D|nr:PIN domain-containing protein [Leptolyngbya sp. UWPOB_LEPTO1]MBN8564342.1 type II toxin-antitoxin system VapC family toxin [Leptolyngbya sp. UWPOB_LEPTO1]